jgi:hypothetical protein
MKLPGKLKAPQWIKIVGSPADDQHSAPLPTAAEQGVMPAECGCGRNRNCLGPCVMGSCLGTCYPNI